MRLLYALAVTGLLLIGCSSFDSARRETLKRLSWSGGNAEQRKARDATVMALKQTSKNSLQTPQLVYARLYTGGPTGNAALLLVDWVCRTPYATGVLVYLDDGTFVRFPINDSYLADNRKTAGEGLLCFQGGIWRRDFRLTWDGLAVAERARGVALATDGVRVSEILPLQVIDVVRRTENREPPASQDATTCP